MKCKNCGYQNNDSFQFCTRCGHPLSTSRVPGVFKTPVHFKRKNAFAIFIAVCIALAACVMLFVLLTANPIAGRWYSQSGTELIMLQNGKGMTVSPEGSGETQRVHFMYAVEYREAGYIEGEIYEKDSGKSTWFYLYDGALELGSEYFYRQKPAVPMK